MDQENPPEPIAIIGTACRLPGGASSPSKLWQLLKNPRDLLRDIPRDRFHWEGVYRADGLHGSIKTHKGYFLDENIREFDPDFFKLSPAEAENLDPQHRLLLENVYEAIESAGLCLEDLQGTNVGVFVGSMTNEYYENANHDVDASSGQILTTGTARSMAANRISYTFDFRGPSISMDTACSSSLMAVHLAVASLRRGESTVAFACGAHLILTPNYFKALSRMSMISADGRSKMFDEAADGYGRGEGTVVVCLKPLSAAVRDGDPIECVIRETGTNQDGRTKGITMPSAEAQAKLIRDTYVRAGLDPSKAFSRPSFFEAHGTGTSVGDPIEASAVEAAFFPPGREYEESESLYIGSIKTVIGHTEGTAGLAGLLRATLAVRHATIPPNLLFHRMSTQVQPYTKHLRLVTSSNRWPALPKGCPRRASVNSFGFGGSNVHVIIESYSQPPISKSPSSSSLHTADVPLFTPFVFSGPSQRALASTLQTYLTHIRENKSGIRLLDLAWTLQCRRSQFEQRCALTASSVDDLEIALEQALSTSERKQGPGPFVHAIPHADPSPRIMGIFTGQGAQWATMGRALLERSPHARAVIEKLDEALTSLPRSDRPDWKLREELLLDGQRSRVNEAALAQPLTTAVQILLVDLIAIAGLRFHTVVGHSSGEIAAAYATGLLRANDAIRVAYYRGLHSREASSKSGDSGAMFAAALSAERAQNLCCLARFQGHLAVAAFNSPKLCTISGDATYVTRAIDELEGDGVFTRRLQVDMAYHSEHMRPCAAPYLRSLKRLQMPNLELNEHCPSWYSSVFPGKRVETADQLGPAYWIQNLLAPVQFTSAVQTAVSQKGVPDLVLEIGPNPTLEKAVRQILGDSTATNYTAFLRRGTSAIESFADALGYIWTRFGRHTINFADVSNILSDHAALPKQIKDLPTYAWRHEAEYWWENRFLRKRYQSTMPPIELLGEEWEIGASHESKWRSFLNPQETPWLLKHRLNGVAVLPGAAYVVMATTAARRIFKDETIIMVEIQDLRFDLPLVFPDEHTAIETVLTIVRIEKTQNEAHADFYVDFCSHPRNDELMTAVRGHIYVRFGFDADRTSPEILQCPLDLTEVNRDFFYKALSDAGYGYSGQFKAVTSVQRRIDHATGEIAVPRSDLIIHPAALDGLFQASFAAESYPADSSMPNFRVPACIRSIKIYPTRCEETFGSSELDEAIALDALPRELASFTLTEGASAKPSKHTTVLVKFDVYRTAFYEYAGSLQSASAAGVLCQMEGLSTVPFRLSTADDDLTMFREITWVPEHPYHLLQNGDAKDAMDQEVDLALVCERVALYYLRQLLDEALPHSERCASPAVQLLVEFARLTVVEVALGEHPRVPRTWLDDDKILIHSIQAQYPDSPDLHLVERMGTAFPSILRGRDTAVDVLFQDNDLRQFYRDGLGFRETSQRLASFVAALTDRTPDAHILEVGAGTGATTEAVLAASTCAHYTFSDISPAFFGSAKENLRQYKDKISFVTFDMEQEPATQGLQTGSFDIVIASNVLHATGDVQMVLQHIRSLIRPGGHLVCAELAPGYLLRNTVIMGGLPGWWLGHGKDRFWSPALSDDQWDFYLKASGFSGLDYITSAAEPTRCPYRVFYTQAVDERVLLLRDPLQHCVDPIQEPLLVIGKAPVCNLGLIEELLSFLSPLFVEVVHLRTFEELGQCDSSPHTVLSLVELQEPFFESLNAERWGALQSLLGQASNITWITTRASFPEVLADCYSNMTVGLMRTICNELPHLNMSILDIEGADCVTARDLADAVLRHYWIDHWRSKDAFGDMKYIPQLVVSFRDGVAYVPIIRTSTQPNDRYNARHRKIQAEVNASNRAFEVAYKRSKEQYVLRSVPQAMSLLNAEPTVPIEVHYTTLFAIRLKHVGSYFLNVGVRQGGTSVIALSDACRSKLDIPKKLVFDSPSQGRSSQCYLRNICAHFVAERVISSSRPTGVIVAIVADPFLMSVVQRRVTMYGKTVLFLTSQPEFEAGRVTFVHHNSLDLNVRQKIPIDASLIANLSTHTDDEILFQRICSVLRRTGVKSRGNEAFFEKKSTGHASGRGLGQCHLTVGTFLNTMRSTAMDMTNSASVIDPKEAVEHANHDPLTIVDWHTGTTVPVTILPATKDVKLSPERAYLVVGSSDIARAICEWMIDSGARYLVVASRYPEHAQDWAHSLIAKGAYVRIVTMDVTDRVSVRRTLASLRGEDHSSHPRTPPIAGAMHLALVLRDAAFHNMTYEDIKAVTDVKANGSLILHEELQDETLDFFIMTSSISYVTGNRGQANYAAGNAFMVGLANHRRSLGLPASVVHLGHVIGIGYIQRHATEETPVRSTNELRKLGLYPISERDLHHIFAEAVLASPASSGVGPEIVTGIRDIEPDMLEQCNWARDQMFAHIITKRKAAATSEPEHKPSHRRQLSKQLAELSTSPDDIRALVTNALARKLGILLQIDNVDETKSLLDLGIDSLVAAEIGSWARKELRVQIPNSLIFGGASMRDVVDVAVRHLDKGWVRLKGSAAGSNPGESI